MQVFKKASTARTNISTWSLHLYLIQHTEVAARNTNRDVAISFQVRSGDKLSPF